MSHRSLEEERRKIMALSFPQLAEAEALRASKRSFFKQSLLNHRAFQAIAIMARSPNGVLKEFVATVKAAAQSSPCIT